MKAREPREVARREFSCSASLEATHEPRNECPVAGEIFHGHSFHYFEMHHADAALLMSTSCRGCLHDNEVMMRRVDRLRPA